MIQFLFTKRGHRAKRKDVFAEMSALLAEPPPRTRKSSPAKRGKVDGKTVKNIPYGAAKVVARYFAQVYLAGRGIRGLSPPQLPEFFGRGPARGGGGLREVVYSWDGGHMILAGSMRRLGGSKTVDKKGIPLPVGDLDFVVVGPAFPPEPDLDALEGGSLVLARRSCQGGARLGGRQDAYLPLHGHVAAVRRAGPNAQQDAKGRCEVRSAYSSN